MADFQLLLVIHAHQPVGNFDDVIEQAYQKSYLPFLETLERHPSVRMGLHYSGCLLEWIERAHPEYFVRLRNLVERNQVELVGGGFYEPILVSLPPEDRCAQIKMLADYIENHFGARPRGAWLTERVWEPGLPTSLATAGVEYSLVDDNQFLGVGFEPSQLFGSYVAEDAGHTVNLIPGLTRLRYTVPFHDPGETIAFLRDAARASPGGFAAMGDDCEKFGVWPKTYEHVYTNGWLERFYQAIEANSDWLETATPGKALSAKRPLGRADLPTASYTEMMEWALPTPARLRFVALEKEFSARADVLGFLRGGTWRGFFTKYFESNLLHKKMLHVSGKVRRMERSRRNDPEFIQARSEARTALFRSQCNDAYWHGVFGGLYSPHLRTELWRSLIHAETLADAAVQQKESYATVANFDFDADGREELYFTSEKYAAVLKPSGGGTVAALDFRPTNVALINSLMRRPEAYHERLRGLTKSNSQAVASIHDQVNVKEDGLERFLIYDRYLRHCFRLVVFPSGKNYAEYQQGHLDEDAGLAAGDYSVAESHPPGAKLTRSDAAAGWLVEKQFAFSSVDNGFELACDISLKRTAPSAADVQVGIETVINFLAPTAPDRYFESRGQRHGLRLSASLPASELAVVDEWQKVRAVIAAPDARDFWIAPIESVSESEEGFERVYQGSQILAVWPAHIAPGETCRTRLILKVSRLQP